MAQGDVLTGAAANPAAPLLHASEVRGAGNRRRMLVGVVCACAALAYAELSTMMPAAGSAYTYSYGVLGESIAWIVGWSLILEYSLVVSTVAVGWSGYFVGFLQWVQQNFGWNVTLPAALAAGPHAGGAESLDHPVGDRADMAVRAAAGDHHGIGQGLNTLLRPILVCP